MSESERRIEVLDSFRSLAHSLNDLCDAINNESELLSWVQNCSFLHSSSILPARDKAIWVLKQLQYLDQQAPREIIICPGFIGGSLKTLDLARKVNVEKERFKKSILALKPDKILPQDPILTHDFHDILTQYSATRMQSLKNMGFSRLHLKQCYRKIPILEKIPYKISWTWAHTRSIKKISVLKAQEMLIKKGNDPGIQIQLQNLNHLPAHESLAIVQELAPHLRANLVFSENNVTSRAMVKGPIPILFPCTPLTPYPIFNPPTEKCAKGNRLTRSDVRLHPIPFLPAIRAHRYSKP